MLISMDYVKFVGVTLGAERLDVVLTFKSLIGSECLEVWNIVWLEGAA